MDLISSKSLDEIVRERNGICEVEAARYFHQIMESIAYLHDHGTAHKDITLKSIFLNDAGKICISNFSICKHQLDDYLTTIDAFAYIPPEILSEGNYNGIKADIWSAGICLYAITTNHLPWIVDDTTPPDKVWEEIQAQICSGDIQFDDKQSELLKDLIIQMLSIDPEYRPDANEILEHPWFAIAGDYEETIVPEPNQRVINTVNAIINNLEK